VSSRRRGPAAPSTVDPATPIEAPRAGLRAPCPCGSGKRYKQCHGRARAGAAFVARPFEGLANETDWVAFREIVPAATMRARTTEGDEVVFATVLPVAWPALRRADGSVYVGIQAADASSDASRDLAAAMDAALAAETPGPVTHVDARQPPPGCRTGSTPTSCRRSRSTPASTSGSTACSTPTSATPPTRPTR
jgi:hypothetical protein